MRWVFFSFWVFVSFLIRSFQLNDEAFTSLDVKEKHYDGVEDLTLDGNKLEDLKKIEKKLLNIPLGMRFSARNNRLTSVSFFR